MLSRLPITLAQLKAGNNSEKLKNKIRQILYSLHRSKKLTKQLYTLKIVKQMKHTDLYWTWHIKLITKIQIKICFSQFEYLLHLEKYKFKIQQQ